jgi:Domain of unknown function DUF29
MDRRCKRASPFRPVTRPPEDGAYRHRSHDAVAALANAVVPGQHDHARLPIHVAQRPGIRYDLAMPDDLHDRDSLAWSQHQANLLRRVARGERVNEVDWQHVIEEIEGVGLSELHAVQNYLHQMTVHLLKVHGWPTNPSIGHWRGEFVAFQSDAARRFAPSMRRRIDLARHYRDALEQLETANYDGVPPRAWPADCPFTLDQLFADKRAALEQHIEAAVATTKA